MTLIQTPGKPRGVDLSPDKLAEKAKHDKIVAVTEEVLELFVKRDCTLEEVAMIKGGIDNVMNDFFLGQKMSSVKEFFNKKK